jgi:hypothetical protein
LRVGDQLDAFQLNLVAFRQEAAESIGAAGILTPCVLEEDWTSTGVRVQDVLDRLAARPPFATLGLNWQPNPIHPGWEHQRRAIALAAESLRFELPPSQRLAGMLSAYRSVKTALGTAVNGSRLFTLARIAGSLGYRAEAVQSLEKLLGSMDAKAEDLSKTFTEPMLLPIAWQEEIVYPDLPTMVRCATFEGYLALGSFSAFFHRASAASVVSRLRSLPVLGTRAQRILTLLEDTPDQPQRALRL